MRFEWPTVTRCCFCFPLRRGIITFGYVTLVESLLMVAVQSYLVHDGSAYLGFESNSIIDYLPAEVCLTIYLIRLVFNALLLYGAHKQELIYIKIFFYYSIVETVSLVVMVVLECTRIHWRFVIISAMFSFFATMCMQVYLLILIYSLLCKVRGAGRHECENHITGVVLGGYNGAALGDHEELCQ
ncbi:hypothetical protein JYU34_008894 [Plutella xylostella]|uniref:Uncharacterized protein n=1 Tax=Plutella xylostella TaxID=51655 RepID=A0ABQ7QM82_PLUXY|nr:hypothetical protein JYU34_008894 [Plutella xylostella]